MLCSILVSVMDGTANLTLDAFSGLGLGYKDCISQYRLFTTPLRTE